MARKANNGTKPDNSTNSLEPCPFLRLPPEIRNQIYEMLLLVKSKWDIGYSRKAYSWINRSKHDTYSDVRYGSAYRFIYANTESTPSCNPWYIFPQLLATSAQIHNEAIGILYSKPFWFVDAYSFSRFSSAIGPENSKLIKSVTIPIFHSEEHHYNTRISYSSLLKSGATASKTLGENLTACTGLETLRLEVSEPRTAELAIYFGSIVFPYLHAMSSKWAQQDGRVDVLEVTKASTWALEHGGGSQCCPVSSDEKARFDAEIKRLMPIHEEAMKLEVAVDST